MNNTNKKPGHTISPNYLETRSNHSRYAKVSPDSVSGIPVAVFYSMLMRGHQQAIYNNKRIVIVDRFAVIMDENNVQRNVYQINTSSREGQELSHRALISPVLAEELDQFYSEFEESEYSYKEACVIIPEGYTNERDW